MSQNNITMNTKAELNKTKAPMWLLRREGLTQRQWRPRKRRELKMLRQSLEMYRLGSSYCPYTQNALGRIEQALREMRASHSVAAWQ